MFDLLWTIAVALRNLRCYAKGVQQELSYVTEDILNQRFSSGTGIKSINFKSSILNTTWEAQQEEIAWIMLIWLISIYEGWTSSLSDELFKNMDCKKLHFPIHVQTEVRQYTSKPSSILKKCFFQPYSRHKKISIKKLDNMLYCYRVFKEMRNCYIHNAKIANKKASNAYSVFSSKVQQATDLHAKEIPSINPIKENKIIRPNLRGVVGLSDILISMILTIDAELIQSYEAEVWFNKKVIETANKEKIKISSTQSVAVKQVYRLLKLSGFHRKPLNITELLTHLKSITK